MNARSMMQGKRHSTMDNELIGKVQLDYSHYSGEDIYSDGSVEDELLDIVRSYSKLEYPKIIEEKASWPILYHLSVQRENIVDWLPIDRSMKILEVGSGCGAITGSLARRAGRVDCVDLSRRRSLINAYRHDDCDNVTIRVGNFTDYEPELDDDYDYILLIGVFEYGRSYIGTDTPYEDFLKILSRHVAAKGRIVMAIENRYGLKYWAGCAEDHLGTYFSSIECYKDGGGVRTFSRKALTEFASLAGFDDVHFYYPYPDYKFMTTLFSDRRLPDKGELCNNMRNFDRDRLLLFDEKAAFDGLLDEDQFPFFSNSYLMVIGSRPETDYIRYSNDRADEYAICTEISGRRVLKRALDPEAGRTHIANMRKNYELLSGRYEGSMLRICPCRLSEDGVSVEFDLIEGRPLSEIFDDFVRKGDDEGFAGLFAEYVKRIGYGEDKAVADLDLVFSNILTPPDYMNEPWTVIDYEWTEYKQIPVRELAFRALYCYLLEDEERNKFNYELIISSLRLTPDEAEGLRDREAAFQKEVTGRHLAMGELRNLIGGAIQPVDKPGVDAAGMALKRSVQIYTDTGRGFNEDESYFISESYDRSGNISFDISVESKAVRVRIDPVMDHCMTTLKAVSLNGEDLDLSDNKRIYVNGRKIPADNGVLLIFYYDDPCIVIEVKDKVRSTGNNMHIEMNTAIVPGEMISALKKEVSKRFRF